MEEQAGYERRDNRYVKAFLLFLFVPKIQNQKGIVMEQTKLFEVKGETLILHLLEELDHHVELVPVRPRDLSHILHGESGVFPGRQKIVGGEDLMVHLL